MRRYDPSPSAGTSAFRSSSPRLASAFTFELEASRRISVLAARISETSASCQRSPRHDRRKQYCGAPISLSWAPSSSEA